MSVKPRRRVQIELSLGADSWKEVASSLRQIALEIDMGQHRVSVVSGGSSAGYIFSGSEDETVTHSSYHEANHAYVASLARPDTEDSSTGDITKKGS